MVYTLIVDKIRFEWAHIIYDMSKARNLYGSVRLIPFYLIRQPALWIIPPGGSLYVHIRYELRFSWLRYSPFSSSLWPAQAYEQYINIGYRLIICMKGYYRIFCYVYIFHEYIYALLEIVSGIKNITVRNKADLNSFIKQSWSFGLYKVI